MVSLLINQRLYLSVVFSSETDLDVRGLNSQAFLLQRIPGIKNELGADNSFWALVEVEAPAEQAPQKNKKSVPILLHLFLVEKTLKQEYHFPMLYL